MRLIDADELKEHICNMCDDGERECKGDESCAMLCWVNDMPTIKEPVRHGRWILIGRGRIAKSRDLKCSVCGNYFRVYEDVTLNAGRGDANFCPNCGARMDGGDDNG